MMMERTMSILADDADDDADDDDENSLCFCSSL